MYKDAVISECRLYRYELTRTWGDEANNCLNMIMLNPSTADADLDDPTIRRCINFAKGFGYHGLVVTNLFALRATDPKELYRAQDPVGPDNDRIIRDIAKFYGEAVCAWGTHGVYTRRDGMVRALLNECGVKTFALGLTKDGHPRHPLYLKAAATRIPL